MRQTKLKVSMVNRKRLHQIWKRELMPPKNSQLIAKANPNCSAHVEHSLYIYRKANASSKDPSSPTPKKRLR